MKKLYRSEKEKKFAGVCGGLGEYFDVDPVIIRVIFLVTFLMGGAGLFIYLILWAAVPKNPNEVIGPR